MIGTGWDPKMVFIPLLVYNSLMVTKAYKFHLLKRFSQCNWISSLCHC